MARKNCPDCGGFEKQGRFAIFRCTKCLNRYKARWRGFLTGVASVMRTFLPILLVIAILGVSCFGYTMYRVDRAFDELESAIVELEESLGEDIARLEESVAQLEKAVDEFEAEIQRLEEELADLEREVEELQRLVEELQKQAESPEIKITVKKGDTVWDLLTNALGRYPTWEEIQKVVDANGLENFMDGQGLWIVLIYPGQVLDLTPALGG